MLRAYRPADLPAVHAINQAEVPAVGSETMEALGHIGAESEIALVAVDESDVVGGFCMVLVPDADYHSGNYVWFGERYDDFVYLAATFNFMSVTDATVVGVGFDLDGDPATGSSQWPRGARLATPGIDLFVTLHGECGWVTTAGDPAPATTEVRLDVAGGAVAVDTRHATIEAAVHAGAPA